MNPNLWVILSRHDHPLPFSKGGRGMFSNSFKTVGALIYSTRFLEETFWKIRGSCTKAQKQHPPQSPLKGGLLTVPESVF